MSDKSQIEALYRVMYKAMIEKDTATLNRVHADDFVLTHMTGMHQSKQEYIRAIAGGTLNYYSAEHEQMDIKVDGNHATLTGRSRVNAAVFGGGRHTWRLQLYFQLSRYNGHWLFTITVIGCSPMPRQVLIKKIHVRLRQYVICDIGISKFQLHHR